MEPKAIGIDIFGGGFTMGVRAAGFKVLAQFEECGAGSRTWDLNRERYFAGIPRPLNHREWDVMLGAHLVYANPPCAPWSSANTRLGRTPADRKADLRLGMTERAMNAAMAIAPEAFVCESVSNAYTMGRAYYDGWAEQWIERGYGVTYYLTDALLVGVPSTRQRFHFIAHRHELGIREPDMKRFMPRTTSMALADLQDTFGHLAHHVPKRYPREIHEAMANCPEGGQLNRDEACARWSFLYRKPLWDAPAYTVINVEMQVHPTRPRLITAREGLRLCGYPDDFVLDKSEVTKAATQAVMPLVGEHVARLLKESFDNGPAQRDLEIVDHRDLAKPYRPGSVNRQREEEIL